MAILRISQILSAASTIYMWITRKSSYGQYLGAVTLSERCTIVATSQAVVSRTRADTVESVTICRMVISLAIA